MGGVGFPTFVRDIEEPSRLSERRRTRPDHLENLVVGHLARSSPTGVTTA
jgi:hypothetical protein